MPCLNKIIARDFRNIVLQELEFSPKLNCISGGNGQGKTNLMDAVWYLSMTKSAFVPSDRYNFRHGCLSFALSGLYSMPSGQQTRISVQVSKGRDASGEYLEKGVEKKVKRDDKTYRKLSSHIGLLPVVMVSPSDVSMVSEGGEERRRFVNSVLSQMDRTYLESLQQYSRLLVQRNSLLKAQNGDDALLSAIDSAMAKVAPAIYEARAHFIEELNPVVQLYYSRLSGDGEKVSIKYISDLHDSTLEEVLSTSRQKDRVMGFTTGGLHRDDFAFSMDSHPIRRYGSQGQQKSFLVALKFAQYEIMKSRYGFAPMLLLDDLFDKLDMGRVHNLLEMVSGNDFGQIFLTDSNKVRLSSIVDSITKERACFEASGGAFTRYE